MNKNSPFPLLAVLAVAVGTTWWILPAKAGSCRGSESDAMATCSPTGICRACKNCNYCAHCAKGGGTCSVCR